MSNTITKTTVKVIHSFGKGKDCTNNGVSEKADYLTISWGVDSVDSADTDLVLCDGTLGRTEVIRDEDHIRSVMGRKFGYIKAVAVRRKSDGNNLGPVNGGNYVSDCNGVSPLLFPVAVHDRYETFDQYDRLTR